ncbi:MAG: hypothetical protein WCD70_04725 [Alphaproteobacteria bacterium]
MKKYVLLTAMVLALAAPSVAWSQTAPGGGSNGGSGQQQGGEQQFQEHKSEMLKRLNEHLAEVQQRIGCVQAAADHEALRACMPERGEGHGNR